MSAKHLWFIAIGLALTTAAPVSAQQSLPANVPQALVAVAAHMPAPAPDLSLSSASAGTLWPSFSSDAVLAHTLTPSSQTSVLWGVPAPVAAPTPSVVPVQSRSGGSDNVAMMIVGGAALVAGSLIGGDTGTIVMVGGATVALIGLYRYLR